MLSGDVALNRCVLLIVGSIARRKEVARQAWAWPETATQSLMENGYIESFNGKLGHELLDSDIFYRLPEVNVLTEPYRHTYNRV